MSENLSLLQYHHHQQHQQHQQQQQRVDYTSFYVSRIQELEEEVQALTIDLTSSRQREHSLHDTIEGFKQLQQDAARKRETADEERDKMSEEVQRLRRQVDALIDDNNSLRQRLKKVDDVATGRVMKVANSVRESNSMNWIKKIVSFSKK